MITIAERRLYDWQYDLSGSFFKGLFDCISRADSKNLVKLSLGYPEEVKAVINYKNKEGYWKDVKRRMIQFQVTEFNVPEVTTIKTVTLKEYINKVNKW